MTEGSDNGSSLSSEEQMYADREKTREKEANEVIEFIAKCDADPAFRRTFPNMEAAQEFRKTAKAWQAIAPHEVEWGMKGKDLWMRLVSKPKDEDKH